MGISTSLILIAAGAILKWAVSASTAGINLNTVGVVLMVVGAVGLVLSLIFWSSWGGFGSRAGEGTVVREDTTSCVNSRAPARFDARGPGRGGVPEAVGASSASLKNSSMGAPARPWPGGGMVLGACGRPFKATPCSCAA